MTDTQFYLLIAVPLCFILMDMILRALVFHWIGVRLTSIKSRMTELESAMDALFARFEKR